MADDVATVRAEIEAERGRLLSDDPEVESASIGAALRVDELATRCRRLGARLPNLPAVGSITSSPANTTRYLRGEAPKPKGWRFAG